MNRAVLKPDHRFDRRDSRCDTGANAAAKVISWYVFILPVVSIAVVKHHRYILKGNLSHALIGTTVGAAASVTLCYLLIPSTGVSGAGGGRSNRPIGVYPVHQSVPGSKRRANHLTLVDFRLAFPSTEIWAAHKYMRRRDRYQAFPANTPVAARWETDRQRGALCPTA
jgi:hypothetical protein